MRRGTILTTVLATTLFAATLAQAGNAVQVVGRYGDDGSRAAILEDNTFSFDRGAAQFVDNTPIDGVFNIQDLGFSPLLPSLDTQNGIDPNLDSDLNPNNDSTSTNAEDITIEGTIDGLVNLPASIALGFDTTTNTGPLVIDNVEVNVYLKNSFEVSPVTTQPATDAAYSDGMFAAQFFDDGVDDFFIFTVNAGQIGFFQLGLTFDTTEAYTASLPPILSETLSGAFGNAVVDVFGSGQISGPRVGDDSDGDLQPDFVTGDANLAINFVPVPAGVAPSLALFGLGVAAYVRRRRNA